MMFVPYFSRDRNGGPAKRGKPEDRIQDGASRRHWLLLVPLVVVAGLLLAGLILKPRPVAVTAIADYHLAGTRGQTPTSFVLLLDKSGSFADYDQMRRDGLQQALTWASAGNLRPDDTFTVITFADDAVLTMPTTAVSDIAAGKVLLDEQSPDGGSTRILPSLQLAAEAIPHSSNVSIVALTDTAVADANPSRARALLEALNARTMSVIIPSGIDIDPLWNRTFDWASTYEANSDDTSSTAIAVGEALAHATGQQLKPGKATTGEGTSDSEAWAWPEWLTDTDLSQVVPLAITGLVIFIGLLTLLAIRWLRNRPSRMRTAASGQVAWRVPDFAQTRLSPHPLAGTNPSGDTTKAGRLFDGGMTTVG
jgi:Mg-chelatase subunit ChlD